MTSIGPYSTVAGLSPSLTRALLSSRDTLDDLSVQASTGKLSTSYAALGSGRSTSLAMRAKLSQLDSYDQTADTVNVRINLMSQVLTQVDTIRGEYSTVDASDYTLTSGNKTTAQSQASTDLQDVISRLNTDVNGRYVFSGRTTDTQPVASADTIMSDDGDKAGLKTVINERKLADLGSDGRGRLSVSAVTTDASGSTFDVAQTMANSPFGFKINAVSSTLTNGVATTPTGSPASTTLGLTAQPNAGETLTVGLKLPDGSTENVTLTAKSATDSSDVAKNEFRIGATPAETVANMQAAFDSSLKTLASTSLVSASAMQAGNEFFTSDGAAPSRVAGFDGTYATDADRVAALQSATGLTTTGTAAKTVSWYNGDTSSDDPRKAAAATVDDGVTVGYGASADESGLRDVVKTLAVFSAMSFSSDDTDGRARYTALASRTISTLGATSTTTAIQSISKDLAASSTAIKTAQTRHDATRSIAEDAVSGVEDVDKEAVAVKIASLQTQLQSSYQIAATLKDLSLVNYLT